jgi:hypothetical protein
MFHTLPPNSKLRESVPGCEKTIPYASRRAASLSLNRPLTYQPHDLASGATVRRTPMAAPRTAARLRPNGDAGTPGNLTRSPRMVSLSSV